MSSSGPLVIERDNKADRWRYTCPNGHHSWEPTNCHIWCKVCAEQSVHDDEVEAEYWELLDQQTGETVDWQDVVFE